MALWLGVFLALSAGSVGGVLYAISKRKNGTRLDAERLKLARAEAASIKRDAETAAMRAARDAETVEREQGLAKLEADEQTRSQQAEQQVRREVGLDARADALKTRAADAQARLDALAEREREAQSNGDRAKNGIKDAEKQRAEVVATLERVAGTTSVELSRQLSEGWVEGARADAVQHLRAVDENATDPEHGRTAKRIMGIAVGRYAAHFLTERNLSNLPIPPGFADYLKKDSDLMLNALAEGTGIKFELSETGEKLRLDSGDGVAKEVARRALARLIKGTAPKGVEDKPVPWIKQIAVNLDKEIIDLGKRAFAQLEIPKAHPEIVQLVGRLNYRTSYTQNQWKHALEASFLGGMMAAELGLDVKLMRRATLMHDIGKSLTHEIDGSHAVIGADYARRLGESEVVANAIGAHHADEPPNSIYAFLVAAADAMSGARPGARREQTESYSTRLGDLERIGLNFRGVDRAYPVHGGREIRVYVREREVNDLRAVELSAEIAKKISDEMQFPGQIKVTVIRSVEAVEIAS